VADAFDALTHKRPYKEAWPVSEAVREILEQRGRQFDPSVVAAFSRLDHGLLVLNLSEGDRGSERLISAWVPSAVAPSRQNRE
jgi:HD-GYP domain-containing protein (c-di-GMP phosphodiesterase class II)